MPNFLIPYTTPSNYTYDNSIIEIDSGLAQLKELWPDALIGLTFADSINATWNNGGLLTPLAVVGTNVADSGRFDCAEKTGYTSYDISSFPATGGTLKFKYTHNIPAEDTSFSRQFLFSIGQANAGSNIDRTSFFLENRYPVFSFSSYVFTKGNFDGEFSFGQRNLTFGVTYEIECIFDWENGFLYLFIDGVQHGATRVIPANLDRDACTTLFIGNYQSGGATESNFYADDYLLFDTIQHTENYTPGYTISPTKYSSDLPTVFKTTGSGIANAEFISFGETLGGNNEGTILYQLSDDGINWLYWDGSLWSSAGAGDYNTEAECEANILNFDSSNDIIYIKAFLISDGTEKVELDENQTGYIINTAPLTYAGLNKTAIYNVAMTPFSDALFSDAEGNITSVKWKVAGGTYVAILIGAYATLLEAVRAFEYTPTHSGNKTLYLKATDSFDESAEDSMIVDVTQVTIDITIKDEDDCDLPGVEFDAGDSSEADEKDSPFSFTYDIGTYTAILTKAHYNTLSESNTITINTTEINFIMAGATRIDDLIGNIDAPSRIVKGDTFILDGVIDTDLTGYKIRCQVSDVSGSTIQLATVNSGGLDSQIEITNASAGEFVIVCAKDLTDNFGDSVLIEIEIENPAGQVRTFYKEKFKFANERLTWTEPS